MNVCSNNAIILCETFKSHLMIGLPFREGNWPRTKSLVYCTMFGVCIRFIFSLILKLNFVMQRYEVMIN